jgi:hypothetical protein
MLVTAMAVAIRTGPMVEVTVAAGDMGAAAAATEHCRIDLKRRAFVPR